MQTFELIQLDTILNIYRLNPNNSVPDSIWQAEFVSVTKTEDELSIVVPEQAFKTSGLVAQECSPNWVALFVKGPLPHDMVGVMAELSNCIANSGCSIFAIATFDTDYILVAKKDLETVKKALINTGHSITSKEPN